MGLCLLILQCQSPKTRPSPATSRSPQATPTTRLPESPSPQAQTAPPPRNRPRPAVPSGQRVRGGALPKRPRAQGPPGPAGGAHLFAAGGAAAGARGAGSGRGCGWPRGRACVGLSCWPLLTPCLGTCIKTNPGGNGAPAAQGSLAAQTLPEAPAQRARRYRHPARAPATSPTRARSSRSCWRSGRPARRWTRRRRGTSWSCRSGGFRFFCVRARACLRLWVVEGFWSSQYQFVLPEGHLNPAGPGLCRHRNNKTTTHPRPPSSRPSACSWWRGASSCCESPRFGARRGRTPSTSPQTWSTKRRAGGLGRGGGVKRPAGGLVAAALMAP